MVLGIHHITAVCGDPQHCVTFYRDVLGLRFIKKTVNFDDPGTYHLYFGDNIGSPGTALTFFPFKGVPQGTPGAGQVVRIVFGAPKESADYWKQRLKQQEVPFTQENKQLHFTDRDGLPLGIAFRGGDTQPWADSDVPAEHQLQGFDNAVLGVTQDKHVTHILTELLALTQENGEFVGAQPTSTLRIQEGLDAGKPGKGTVHHIAFRVEDYKDEREHMKRVRTELDTTDVIDRKYFRSVYFRIPEGILFELATDGPGFTVDEEVETLGEHLQLPPWYEAQREAIEEHLGTLE